MSYRIRQIAPDSKMCQEVSSRLWLARDGVWLLVARPWHCHVASRHARCAVGDRCRGRPADFGVLYRWADPALIFLYVTEQCSKFDFRSEIQLCSVLTSWWMPAGAILRLRTGSSNWDTRLRQKRKSTLVSAMSPVSMPDRSTFPMSYQRTSALNQFARVRRNFPQKETLRMGWCIKNLYITSLAPGPSRSV